MTVSGMPLDEEIVAQSQQIATDSYAMSVGELVNLYKDSELNLHPEFQRFFRWSDSQKSRLIESLLLGIPIPPLFVAQDENGKWDIVDGLQRLSTILQLTGDLKNELGEQVSPLVLGKTKYLPSLAGKRWIVEDGLEANQLPDSAKLAIKRARIDMKIVLNKSDASTKYELFDRLNTGGSSATDQEIRNCILVMINKPFFEWLVELSSSDAFKDTIPLSERQFKEKFDLELVVRFLTLAEANQGDLADITDLGPFLTERIIEFAKNPAYDKDRAGIAFHETFNHLSAALGENSFKKFNAARQVAKGPPLISLFEIFALGIGSRWLNTQTVPNPADTQSVHHSIPDEPDFITATGSGVRATSRLPVTIPLGRRLLS